MSRPERLVAALLVHDVPELLRLAREEEREVLEKQARRARDVLGIGAGIVRRDEQAGQPPQYAVLREGLTLEDVERCSRDPSFAQGADERSLLDLLAPP